MRPLLDLPPFWLFVAVMTVEEKQLSLWDYGYELVIVVTTFIFIYKYYKNKKKVRRHS